MISRSEKWAFVFATLVFVLAAAFSLPAAETLVVAKTGAGFSSIQAAIDAAEPGDTVQIKKGTYKENLSVDKSLTLKGRGAGEVIIDGVKKGHSVLLVGPGEITVKAEGLSFSGAEGEECSDKPKGVCPCGLAAIGEASIRLNESVVVQNSGAGIDLYDSSQATITNSKVTNNNNGIWLYDSARATIQQSAVTENTYGGILPGDSTTVTIKNSRILKNGWAGIWFSGSAKVNIQHSEIRGNGAGIESTSTPFDGTLDGFDNIIKDNDINFKDIPISTQRELINHPLQGEDLNLTDASPTKTRDTIMEANKNILETMGWFKADEYFKNNYHGPIHKSDGIDTIIIFLDTGVAEDSWVRDSKTQGESKKYSYQLLPGGDIVEEDNDPTDYEDVEFKYRHGEMVAQELATLTPNTGLLSIKTSLAGEGPTLSDTKIGLKASYWGIKNLEKEVGRGYNVVLNISSAFSEVIMSSQLRRYWEGEYGKSKLLPLFKKHYKGKLKKAGYEPDELKYYDMFKKDKDSSYGVSVKDEGLYDIAKSWLFKALYSDCSLSPELEVKEGKGWKTLKKMKQDGWLINGPGGKEEEVIYPSATKEVEAIDEATTDRGFIHLRNPQGDLTELAAPRKFKVYNYQKDRILEAEGACGSTAFTSSLEAKLWNLSPNLSSWELERIVKGTATEIKKTVFEEEHTKKLVHPYRAIRVSHVYGEIKELIGEYSNDQLAFNELKREVRTVLDDTESAPSFADTNTINKIFFQSTEKKINPLGFILAVILVDSKKVVPDVGDLEFYSEEHKN